MTWSDSSVCTTQSLRATVMLKLSSSRSYSTKSWLSESGPETIQQSPPKITKALILKLSLKKGNKRKKFRFQSSMMKNGILISNFGLNFMTLPKLNKAMTIDCPEMTPNARLPFLLTAQYFQPNNTLCHVILTL